MRDTQSRRITLGVLALALVSLTACGNGSTDASDPTTAPASGDAAGKATSSPDASTDLSKDFAALERKFDARLGVHAFNTETGREVRHNPDERFAYASTFKSFVAGVVLHAHTSKELDEVITYDKEDLVQHSPATEKHVDTGMSLRDLAAATLRLSDNTAVNLLLKELGGPKAVGTFLKEEADDDVTRMNRYEPELNNATPGDTRDTSTPRAFATSLEAFLLGDVLDKGDRAQLTKWMRTNETGSTLIQAGVPDSWTVADKSGAGGYGTRNNIAVVWPDTADKAGSASAPIVVAIMSKKKEKDAESDDALVAEAAALATKPLVATGP